MVRIARSLDIFHTTLPKSLPVEDYAGGYFVAERHFARGEFTVLVSSVIGNVVVNNQIDWDLWIDFFWIATLASHCSV